MTLDELTALKAEIENDPLSFGYRFQGPDIVVPAVPPTYDDQGVMTDPGTPEQTLPGPMIRKSNSTLLKLLNTPDSRWTKDLDSIPISTVMSWATSNGLTAELQAMSELPLDSSSKSVKSIGVSGLLLFSGGFENFQVDDSPVGVANKGFLDAVIALGKITEADKTSLLNNAKANISRAESLFGKLVTDEDLNRSY